jgi:predicted MFS family arabinose efflux permease
LPSGRLAERRGLKFAMACSIVGATVGTVLAAIWPVYPVLCVAALLTGGSVGLATIAVQRHVGRLGRTPTQMKEAYSWVSLAPAASNFLGPFAAGLVIDSFGFRAAFLLLASLAVVSWLLIRAARELPHEDGRAAAPGTAWNLWHDPSFRRLMVMNWLFSASWDIHGFMVPVLGHERGLSASAIGSVLAAFALAAASIRLAMPFLAPRVREWLMITGAIAATGMLLAVYPFARSALAMGACSALIGMALGAVQPMVMIMLHQITPPQRHGQAVAMRVLMINASSVAMPVLFGAAGGLVGASGVFWAMGLLVGLGSHLGYGLRRKGGDADGD